MLTAASMTMTVPPTLPVSPLPWQLVELQTTCASIVEISNVQQQHKAAF